MPRSHEKIESLLRLRQLEEDRARGEFQRVEASFRTLEGRIDDLAREREEAKARYGARARVEQALDIEMVLQQRRYINSLYQRILEHGQELRAVGEQLERARAALVEASSRRKVVEKLRDRKREAWQREIERREDRELDELGQVYSQRGGEELS